MRPLLLAIALGVATTVVIAWVCVLRPLERWGGAVLRAPSRPVVAVVPGHDNNVLGLDVTYEHGVGWLCITSALSRAPHGSANQSMLEVMDRINQRHLGQAPRAVIMWLHERAPVYQKSRGDKAVHAAFGWPSPAMMYELLPSGVEARPYDLYGGIQLVRDVRAGAGAGLALPSALPLRPMVRGFLLDTLLFATAWFLALVSRGIVLRVLRHHHGACLRCGYPLREWRAPGCPECGWRPRRSAELRVSSPLSVPGPFEPPAGA